MARAQTPQFGTSGLDPESFLPPAPHWSGDSEKLIVPPTHKWITPSEKTGLTATPTYDETIAFLKKIEKACPFVRLETFATTPQGRPLVAALIGKDHNRNSNRNKRKNSKFGDKLVFLIQAGIHSGEIDGKDAGLMLIRDICFNNKDKLIDKVDIVFIPILNADGHERSSRYNRPNQRGPINQGWRNTAQNLNLNRDYMKLDSPELNGVLNLINKYDPSLYIDLHVTDGMDYQYDITYGFDGWDNLYADSPNIGRWLNNIYRPAIDNNLKAANHIPGPLIFARDDADLSKGLDFNAFAPRFSQPYGDLRRMPAVLVENHSLKPYRQRVLGTYVLLEATLKALASNGKELKAAIRADRALRPTAVNANWQTATKPVATWDFATIQSQQAVSTASGRAATRFSGMPGPIAKVPVYGSEPGVKLSVPQAYWAPSTKPDVIARLKAHGIKMETIKTARTVKVDMIRLTGFKTAAPSEGRIPVTATGVKHEMRTEIFPPGSVRVSTDQPLGALATYLLEPESEDSFFAWGFFTEILQRVEYMEPYAIAPMAERMLASDPKLKAEFEKRLKDDAAFAASPLLRLQFFYERSPFYDDRYLLYPVGRELAS